METDNIHSITERAMRNIGVPTEYIAICNNTKKA